MNKRSLIMVGGLLVAGGLIVLGVWMYTAPPPEESAAPTQEELRRELAARGTKLPPSSQAAVPIKPIAPNQSVRLAIGWLGLSGAGQNEQVADLVLARLGSARNLQTIDRQSLDKVLKESALSLSGLVRAQSAVKVGKLLRADWFLLGSAATVNGSNYVVVRIVDARTGVMRDAAVFGAQKGTTQLASDLAAFIVQSRAAASQVGKPREYLALGGFQDLSINNRQGDFPARLRGYLAAIFVGNTNVTLLEREFVETLLKEVRLDLAGLTEEGTNSTPMQAAFWLVDGYYQSYEATGFEVEVVLNISRMFGSGLTGTLRGAPEEPLFRQITSLIESNIAAANPYVMAPTHRSETWAQLEAGKKYSQQIVHGPGAPWSSYLPSMTDGDKKRVKHNLEEAIRAYRTVLILEPENHDAKMGLAACLENWLIGQESDARSLVREVAEAAVPSRLTPVAMIAMSAYCRGENDLVAAEWLKRAVEFARAHPALGVAINSRLDYLLRQADEIIALEKGRTNAPPEEHGVKAILMDGTRQMQVKFRQKGMFSDGLSGYGIESFVKTFGTNRTDAVRELNELLPDLLEKFPDLEPDLLAIAVTYQVETNNPVVARFVESFQNSASHPEKLLLKYNYFWRLGRNCYNWCIDRKLYALALELVEAKRKAQVQPGGGIDPTFTLEGGYSSTGRSPEGEARIESEDKMRMVYAYMGMGRWREALDIIESYPKHPFPLWGRGPWGRVVIPTELADQCREKLGLPVQKDARLFRLEEPLWSYHAPGVFTTDKDSLWGVACCRLWQVDLIAGTNVEIKLPKNQDTRIAAICSTPSKLWLGTEGDGLIEYDKTKKTSRAYTEKDGLLINKICALYFRDDTLWIGYGYADGMGSGGVGRMNPGSGQITSFTRSLRGYATNTAAPPTASPLALTYGGSGEILASLTSPPRLYRYRSAPDEWDLLPWEATCITSDSKRLVVGLVGASRRDKSLNGVAAIVQTLDGGGVEKLGDGSGLPVNHVTTVALDGNDLWVGGPGFIGVMDLDKKAVRKLCYIRSSVVDHIEVAGGYVWVQFDQNLYRIPVSVTK